MKSRNDTEFCVIDRIKLGMRLRAVTMAELAERASVPYRSLQSNLSGTHRFSAATIAKISDALAISSDWLLLGKSPALDPSIVAATLQIVEDVRGLSDYKISFDDCATLFMKQYNNEFFRDLRRVPSLREQRREQRRRRAGNDD